MYVQQVDDDFLVETLSKSQQTIHYLPMLKGMLKSVPENFEEPVKTKIVTPQVDKKYKAVPTDPPYIRGSITPDS